MQLHAPHLRVSIAGQRLDLVANGRVLRSWPVSTSAVGVGTEPGSLRTPTGRFRIARKVGHGAPPGMVFRSRIASGEIGAPENPEDLVQTRILWLDGLDPDNAGTFSRYIYIHGTNHESDIGTPASHGCVRMRNVDVIDLFDAVDAGTEVIIASD